MIVGGIAFAAFFFWVGWRRADKNLHPLLRESFRLEKSDPARSQLLADQYFEGTARRDQAERTALWERAPRDRAAAEELRRRLLEDLETDAEVQREFRESADPDFHRTLTQSQQSTREQIAKLDSIISGLSSG